MEIGQNSVHYDPEKKELQVVTCYNKLQFKTLQVQDPYLRYMRYLFYAKDRELSRLPAMRGFQAYCWGCRLVLLVAALYFLNRGLYYLSEPPLWVAGILAMAFSLLVFYLVVRLPALWMGSINRSLHRTKVPKLLRPTWEGIDRGFADLPEFRQEIVLTPEGYTLNTPYPDAPQVRCQRGQYIMRAVQDEGDVYVFQLQERKPRQVGYLLLNSLHFAKSSYTDADWSALLGALQELGYL